jgi:hypothetical protein
LFDESLDNAMLFMHTHWIMKMITLVAGIVFLFPHFSSAGRPTPTPAPSPYVIPGIRVMSVYIAQSFINDQIHLHSSTNLIQDLKLELDPDHGHMFLHGIINVPTEELRAINLEPKLGRFRFQVAIKMSTSAHGHLILEFPLNETYFYPADSKDPHDRVVIPTQMLSLALASARGYLAALSGDFKGFDRRAEKIEALVKSLDRAISSEKNADAKEELKTERDGLKVQLEAIPIERKQLQAVSKEVASVLGFTGEQELERDFGARKNALILKIRLQQLTPFLTGVDLGSIRIIHDRKDGDGENYLAIDIVSQLVDNATSTDRTIKPSNRPGAKIAPSIMLRLNQSLLESQAVVSQEKKNMSDKLKDFDIQLKDDGLHVSGRYHALLFNVPFDTLVDFASTGPDVFEARVRDIQVAGMDMKFLRKFVLEAIQKRLENSLKGMCSFKFVGEEKDDSMALQVTVDTKALAPAFPNLHLVDVDVREKEFIMKLGRIESPAPEK